MSAADQSAGMRLARWSAALIIVGVGAAAFRLSFSTLEDLATLARIPAGDAWLFPLIVDGTILLATFGVLVCAHHRSERRFFIGVLVVGSLVSVAGNSVHAVAAGQPLPGWAAALVAAVAPVSLLVDTHGLAVLFRVAATTREPVTEPAACSHESAASATGPELAEQVEPVSEVESVAVPKPDIRVSEPAGVAPAAESEPVVAPSSVPASAPAGVSDSSRPVQDMLPIAVPIGG